MAYSSRSDIENIFGVENVKKWADLDNERDEEHIASRITWALGRADVEVDSILTGGPYRLPFESTPALVKELAAQLAGVFLYESRGIDDAEPDGDVNHRLAWHRDDAYRKLRRIRGGALSLGITKSVIDYPTVITDE